MWFCGVLDNSRDHLQSLPEHRALAADGMLKGSGLPPPSPAQFRSSLPAPPRVSNLLPPPPRVGSQNTGVDSRGRDGIGSSLHAESRLMSLDHILPGLVAAGDWLAPHRSQRGARDRQIDRVSSGRDNRPQRRGFDRRYPSDKWRYKRSWRHTDRDRDYPRRHRHDELARNDDESEEDKWQPEAGSVDQSRDSDTSVPPEVERPTDTNDTECSDVTGSSSMETITVPPS